MRLEEVYLRDILESANAIESMVVGLDLETFSTTRTVRSAVLHELTVIGEACSKLSSELRHQYAEVPWSDIIGFRHVIVHAYFGLTWERVWRTVIRDVPELKTQVAIILAREFGEGQ